MLVVMGAVDHVAVGPVDEVVVAEVGDRRVAASRSVHVHVATVLDVDGRRGPVVELVDVPSMGMVDMAIVDEVEVVLVREHRVAAQPVMLVRVLGGGAVDGGVGHELSVPR